LLLQAIFKIIAKKTLIHHNDSTNALCMSFHSASQLYVYY
jgi:hypothetical protein